MYFNFVSCFFVFFKKKTAYEMLISDWSSDVCSSDLGDDAEGHDVGQLLEADMAFLHLLPDGIGMLLPPRHRDRQPLAAQQQLQFRADPVDLVMAAFLQLLQPLGDAVIGRSEERRVGKECVSTC